MSDIMVNGLSEKTNISEILNSEGKYKKKTESYVSKGDIKSSNSSNK